MDNYHDNLGANQYGPSLTPNLSYGVQRPLSNIVRTCPTDYASGFYEDSLRFGQYAIPSRLKCKEPNPYIQDDIRKEQRFNPIRLFPVKDRADVIAKTSCEPDLCGTEYPIASDQKVVIVQSKPTKDCATCNNCVTTMNCTNDESCKMAKDQEHDSSKKESFTVYDDLGDTMTLFIIFIFLVLIFMCFYYWKSVGDIKETLAVMKELLTQKA